MPNALFKPWKTFELGSFHVVITNFDCFTFRKITYLYFLSDFQFISKIKHSSMVVLMKCSCSNTRWYQFCRDVSVSWKKSSNCHKFRQNVLPFHNQWKIWTLSVHSILMLWRPNLVRNCSIVYRINWYLHDVDTIIIWVAMSWWIIRSYPYPQNSGIPEVVTFFLIH